MRVGMMIDVERSDAQERFDVLYGCRRCEPGMDSDTRFKGTGTSHSVTPAMSRRFQRRRTV